MHIDKASLLEEPVDRIGAEGSYPEHRLEGIGTLPQVGHGTQILQGMALFLQGIIRRGRALDLHLRCLDLKGLLCLRRRHQLALYDHRRANVQLGNLCEIGHGIVIHDLKGLEEGSVVQHDKSEAL